MNSDFGCLSSSTNTQFDPNAMFETIHEKYVMPEVRRRWPDGVVPDDCRIWRVTVLFPAGTRPFVRLNDEQPIEATVKIPPTDPEIGKGKPVYVDQVQEVQSVAYPEHNGLPCSFVLVDWNDASWDILFDFTPDEVDFNPTLASKLGSTILRDWVASSLKTAAVGWAASPGSKQKLHAAGLWLMPRLAPHPFAQIAKLAVADCDQEAAEALLRSHCDTPFIQQMVAEWSEQGIFGERQTLLDEALTCHSIGHYGAAVHTLLPQIEGIVTDYLIQTTGESKWRVESKLRDLAMSLDKSTTDPIFIRAANATIAWFLGPILASFCAWEDTPHPFVANRHSVAHGQFHAPYYTETASIRAFMQIDGLAYVLTGHFNPSTAQQHAETDQT